LFPKMAFCRPCREKLQPLLRTSNASSPSSSCSLHSDIHPQRLVLQIYKPLLNISKGHFNPCLFLWRVAAKWAVVRRHQGIFRTPGCQNKISPTHSRSLGPHLARLPPPRRDHSTTAAAFTRPQAIPLACPGHRTPRGGGAPIQRSVGWNNTEHASPNANASSCLLPSHHPPCNPLTHPLNNRGLVGTQNAGQGEGNE
jgi:hypothetical protein